MRWLGRERLDGRDPLPFSSPHGGVGKEVAVVLEYRLLRIAEGIEVSANSRDHVGNEHCVVSLLGRSANLPADLVVAARARHLSEGETGGSEDDAWFARRRPAFAVRCHQLPGVALLQRVFAGGGGERPLKECPGSRVAPRDRSHRFRDYLGPASVGTLERPGHACREQRCEDAAARCGTDGLNAGQ
jgi:hypothetical protein